MSFHLLFNPVSLNSSPSSVYTQTTHTDLVNSSLGPCYTSVENAVFVTPPTASFYRTCIIQWSRLHQQSAATFGGVSNALGVLYAA